MNNRERFPNCRDPNHMCYECASVTETESRLYRCKPSKGKRPFWMDDGCREKWKIIDSRLARYGEICRAFVPKGGRGDEGEA